MTDQMSDPMNEDFSPLFPILSQLVFFNHAGVAPISGPAATAIRQYAQQAETAAYYRAGWYAQAAQVKKLAAMLINAASSDEIAFVANTSTGLSLVAKGLDWQPGDQVVITQVEYPANRYPWEDLKRYGVELIEVAQRPDGRIDPGDIVAAVTGRCRVVAVSHVQYASGYRIDLRPISEAVHGVGGYLCVDAIQSLGVFPVDVQELGIDFLSADGHKWLLSPEGCGLFYGRRELLTKLHPNVVGWMNMVDSSDYGHYRFEFEATARRFEPGSYNIPGILALGASLKLLLDTEIDRIWSRIDAVTGRLRDGLADKGYRVFSPGEPHERSGIVSFDPPPEAVRATPPIAKIVDALEQWGIIIVERAGRLRASPHFYNTADQVDALLEALP